VSRTTTHHALEKLKKRGQVRHVESKPLQVIWRQAERTESPMMPHEQRDAKGRDNGQAAELAGHSARRIAARGIE